MLWDLLLLLLVLYSLLGQKRQINKIDNESTGPRICGVTPFGGKVSRQNPTASAFIIIMVKVHFSFYIFCLGLNLVLYVFLLHIWFIYFG